MKRVLAFLLLFGGGFALLLFVERRRGGGEATLLPAPAGPSGQEGATEPVGPVQPPAPPPEQGPAGVLRTAGDGHIGVRGEALPDGSKPLVYEIDWRDSAPAPEGRVELRDVRVLIYEPGSGVLQAEVLAERGLVTPREETRSMQLDIQDEIELYDATITAYGGLPVTPIVLHTTEVKGSLRERTFTTEERATVAGPGLIASGTGLGLDGTQGRIVFQRDVRVDVTTPDGAVLSLTCRDLLGLRRDPEGGEGGLYMTARGAARLAGAEEGSPVLEADELDMRGRRSPGTAGAEGADSQADFAPRSVGARGSVRYESGELVLVGDEADLDLSATGEVVGGTLSGQAPRASLVLQRGVGGLLPEGAAADEPVVLVGESLITLERAEEELVITAPGAARVEWGEIAITATRGVTGRGETEGTRARLSARGDVVVSHPGGTLSAPGLVARVEAGPDHEPVLTATAAAPSRTEGETGDGVPFTFTTEGALTVELATGRWGIREAHRAELLLHDESGFVARADRVTDLDPETLALSATGSVSVSGVLEGEPISATGEELVAESRTNFTVRSHSGARSTFSGPTGSGQALSVARRGDALQADGEVEAHFADEDISYDLTCEHLRADLGAGPANRTAHAEGSVAGTLRLPGRTIELACASADIARSVGTDGSEATTLLADGVERANVTLTAEGDRPEEKWEVQCKRLDAGLVVDAEGLAQREDVVAREDVAVMRRTEGQPPFYGFGDRLRLDNDGGRLEALSGARVRTSGELPGLGWPFRLDADWVEFDELRVNAGGPDLHLTRLGEVLPGGGSRPESPLRVVGNELSATEQSVIFSGDVEIDGETNQEVQWNLRTENARLEGPSRQDLASASSAGEGEQSDSWRTLHTWGGYTFRLGASVTSSGERATAVPATGRLMLEGEPATLNYGGLHMASTWIELDTLSSTWRSGPFTIGQAVGGPRP